MARDRRQVAVSEHAVCWFFSKTEEDTSFCIADETHQFKFRPWPRLRYYRTRSDRSVETLKVTALTETESLAVLDVQWYAQRRHDTKTGPQIVRRNADDLHTVAADNGFQDWHTEYEIAALDLDYLVLYQGSSLMATANNALIRSKGYSQRWMAETSYSTTKRSLGDTVRAQSWYRQFREIILMFAITNIESLCEPL